MMKNQRSKHCVKNAQIRSFFWSVFSRNQTECGKIKIIIIIIIIIIVIIIIILLRYFAQKNTQALFKYLNTPKKA